MVIKQLDDDDLVSFLELSTSSFLQEITSLTPEIDFNTVPDKVMFDFDFYLDDLKLGELSVIINDTLKLQSFQPLKEKPFLKRNGLDETSSEKTTSYHFGLLAQAKMCKDLVGSYGSKKIEYSKPISPLAIKFYEGLGIDVYSKPAMKFKDYSAKIFEEANKRGFEF